jgi:hypothetical protein
MPLYTFWESVPISSLFDKEPYWWQIVPILCTRATMNLVPHLGGVGERDSGLQTVWLSPGIRGSTHLCGNIQNMGKIMSIRKNKFGKRKNKKGKSEEGNPLAGG